LIFVRNSANKVSLHGEDAGRNKDLSDWLHNLSIGWMAVVFFGCAYLSAAVIYAVIVEFPTSLWVRARAFSGSMLSPMGTLFALFVVFTAAQVWTDNDQATAAVDKEANALRDVLILASAFPRESRGQLETLIHNHIEEAATKEWPMMAHRSVPGFTCCRPMAREDFRMRLSNCRKFFIDGAGDDPMQLLTTALE